MQIEPGVDNGVETLRGVLATLPGNDSLDMFLKLIENPEVPLPASGAIDLEFA